MHPIIHILLQMLLTFTIRKLCLLQNKDWKNFPLVRANEVFLQFVFPPSNFGIFGSFCRKR